MSLTSFVNGPLGTGLGTTCPKCQLNCTPAGQDPEPAGALRRRLPHPDRAHQRHLLQGGLADQVQEGADHLEALHRQRADLRPPRDHGHQQLLQDGRRARAGRLRPGAALRRRGLPHARLPPQR